MGCTKLLALDQSSRTTGYAIFENNKLIGYGKFTVSDSEIEQRLFKIRQKIQSLIEEHNITEVVMEDIQLQNNVVSNVQTFKTLAQVFGVISELLVELKIPQSAVLSTSWKSTLGIKGRTRPEQKRNAQQWVINTYNVSPTQDECDAICLGEHKIRKGESVNPAGFDWSE